MSQSLPSRFDWRQLRLGSIRATSWCVDACLQAHGFCAGLMTHGLVMVVGQGLFVGYHQTGQGYGVLHVRGCLCWGVCVVLVCSEHVAAFCHHDTECLTCVFV